MEIWEVTNPAAGTRKNSAQSSYKTADGVVSEYSKILAEKLSNVKADMREMEKVQAQLDEICDLQEELTGRVKVDEDSGNANRKEGTVSNLPCVEKVKRYLPDGSILVTTYEDGKISDRLKMKPHMIVVPDYTAPPKPDGSVETTLKATQNLDLMELFML